MPRTLEQNEQIGQLIGQLALSHGMNKERAEAVMRKMVHDISGQDSTKALTAEQADQLIARLDGLGNRAGLPHENLNATNRRGRPFG